MQVSRIDLRNGCIDPRLSLRELHLRIADGVKILIERLSIVLGKLSLQRSSIGDEEIQRTLTSRQSSGSIFAAGLK